VLDGHRAPAQDGFLFEIHGKAFAADAAALLFHEAVNAAGGVGGEPVAQ